jgi:hypothetical protein
VPGRSAGTGPGAIWQIPVGTNLTIVRLGGIDQYQHYSPEQIAAYLNQIVDSLHARGSAVILVKAWPGAPAGPGAPAALTAVGNKADLFVSWWDGFFIALGRPLPQYDAGDGEHLNDAATDIIVARAVPDMERTLIALGFRPGS